MSIKHTPDQGGERRAFEALWELYARVGDAHENYGRNHEKTMEARATFHAALMRALSAPQEASKPEPAEMQWVSVYDRVPEVGQEVLVYGQSPWEKAPSIKVDRWDEIHEAPVSFSSATICVGEGWVENESDDITYWRKLPSAPIPEEDRRTAALERMARLDDEMGIEP